MNFFRGSQDMTYFDVTDVLSWLCNSRTVSGIQRVLVETARVQLQVRMAGNPVNCIFHSADGKWRILDSESLLALVQVAGRNDIDWQRVYAQFMGRAVRGPAIRFTVTDLIYFLDAGWMNPGQFDTIKSLGKDRPQCIFYVHDLIPLKFPEYVSAEVPSAFSYWMHFVRRYADGVVCNSEATKSDFLEMTGYVGPVGVVKLNIHPELQQAGEPDSTEAVLDALELVAGKFVLMVGTIEPRKNHISAINVWVELRRRFGSACPKLVIAGRVGWNASGICEHIRVMGAAGGIVHLEGLNDAELETLYRHALFTVYPSRYEGWGLPITESLAFGKVCVSADNSSLPEAGQGLTLLVDARNERSIEEAAARLIENPEFLRKHEAKIRAKAKFKTWHAFLLELLKFAENLPRHNQVALAVLDCQSTSWFGRYNYFKADARNIPGDFLRSGECWHPADGSICWSSSRSSGVSFKVDNTSEYAAYVFLAAPSPWAILTLKYNGSTVWQGAVQKQKLLWTRLGQLKSGQVVRLDAETDSMGSYPADGLFSRRKTVGVGWIAIRLVRLSKIFSANDMEPPNTVTVLTELLGQSS